MSDNQELDRCAMASVINAHRHSPRVSALVLGGILLLLLSHCTSGSRITGDEEPSKWPSEATGRFERVREEPIPAIPQGIWVVVRTDTVTICGEPFDPETDAWVMGEVIAISRHISDTLYEVITDFEVILTDAHVCTNRVTMSSRETEMPPSSSGWRFIHRYSSVTCPQVRGFSERYTFSRVGDFDCVGTGALSR